ncbi:hypothetical protein M514_03942 [Trichuris suis]|uniref:Uncharacterized protein n=1 Tax=Trichuris suis TaxID=68888 RepID=A0A085MDK5_9BILA|nr:hypothetical protein M513_03942 [Trichuris suis]KFD65902.1 hypothetical protein M514_03942 [Trichuris suis]KHJ45152.1 hypothetical protein D918_04456 [Trichuris suis]
MFTLLLLLACTPLALSVTVAPGEKKITVHLDEEALKYWKKNLAPPDLDDVEDETLKRYFERQYTQCIYPDEEERNEQVKVIYFWPFRAVEIPCLCDEDGLINGQMKKWRYAPFTDDTWDSDKWLDKDSYVDVKDNLEEFYLAFMNISQRSTIFRVPPMFTQQDGLLVIYKAGLEVQGVYNCYDDESTDDIKWVYLLIAMAIPVAYPCSAMSEFIDRNVILHQTNVFCPYKVAENGLYIYTNNVTISEQISDLYCHNAARAPDICNAKMNQSLEAHQLDAIGHFSMYYVRKGTNVTRVGHGTRLLSYHMNHGRQMLVFPYEAWQLAYYPTQYPMEKVEDTLLERDSFTVKMVWSPWSHCTGCKPYTGWQTREGHCYFAVTSKEWKLPADIDSINETLFCHKGYYHQANQASGVWKEYDLGVSIYNGNTTYLFEKGFKNMATLLKADEFKEKGIRLMSSIFVDAFCGRGHGNANCSCLQRPYRYFFERLRKHLPAEKGKKYGEPYKKHGIVRCFDYSEYDGEYRHEYDPYWNTVKIGIIYTYAGGYYIEQRECYQEC